MRNVHPRAWPPTSAKAPPKRTHNTTLSLILKCCPSMEKEDGEEVAVVVDQIVARLLKHTSFKPILP